MAQFGELEVLVIQATQLRDVEAFGRQDPKVILELSGQRFTTTTRTDKGKNPTFNERFRWINISSQYATEMSLKVMNHNVVTSDTLIGEGRVPMAPVYAERTKEVRVPLVSEKGKAAGELQLLFTFTPSGAPARPATPAPTPAPAPAPTVLSHAAAPARPMACASAAMQPPYASLHPQPYVAAAPMPAASYAAPFPYQTGAPAPSVAAPAYPYGQPAPAFAVPPPAAAYYPQAAAYPVYPAIAM